jgi:hypothetical protein
LERILKAIEAGAFPARIKELHVFGSYARGALNLDDLDLIVVHEPAPRRLMERFEEEIVRKYGSDIMYWRTSPERKFHALMCRPMRRPGEKMDILLGTSIDEVLRRGNNLANAQRVLLWSEADRDWRSQLRAMKADPSAGRYERGHFAPVRRFHCEASTMEKVSEAIAKRIIKLTRIASESVDLSRLNPTYRHWLDWWTHCKVMGKDSMKLLPYGLWWMQQQRGQGKKSPHPPSHDAVMPSEDFKYAVFFGRPSLYAVLNFDPAKGYRKICLIPHFKRNVPNELFIFQCGEKFVKAELDKIRDSHRRPSPEA